MINLNVSTRIYRPIHQVFDFVSTPENDFQWQYGTLGTSRVSIDVSKIGSFFRSIGHMLGQRMESTFEVTKYELNRKYAFKSISGPIHSQTSYTFEVDSGGTKISISTQAHPVNAFKMNERVIEKQMQRQLKENLALLKNILEGKLVLSGSEALV